MNPSTLHFSKGQSLFIVALMAAVGGLCICFLLNHPLFAEAPPPLPSPSGAFETPVDSLAYLDRLRESQPSDGHAVDRLTGGWASALLLIACVGMGLWEIAVKLWRVTSSQAALQVQNRHLVPHPSFVNAPQHIALDAIHAVIFDRSDRVRADAINSALTSYSLTNRLAMKYGGRRRHVLLIEYFDERGYPDSLRVNDAEIDGGVEQLKRFADYLEKMQKRP